MRQQIEVVLLTVAFLILAGVVVYSLYALVGIGAGDGYRVVIPVKAPGEYQLIIEEEKNVKYQR